MLVVGTLKLSGKRSAPQKLSEKPKALHSQERPEHGARGAEVAAGGRLHEARAHRGDDVDRRHAGQADQVCASKGYACLRVRVYEGFSKCV